jgi:hypothetical protein
MENVNEYDQIRKSLNRIRKIQLEVQTINLNDKGDDNMETTQNTKSGEEISFDQVNTIGYLNSNENVDDIKDDLIASIGEFIKSSGLMLDTISIIVEDNRIILTTETVNNPGSDLIKAITFDTKNNAPTLEVITGSIELSDDLIDLLQNINRTFKDNQIGRNKLIDVTQGRV